MTWVKICGIVRENDAQQAVDLGVDALGFNFFRGSPRYIAPKTAAGIIANLPEDVEIFGIFVNEVDSLVREVMQICRLTRVQFHGDESLNYCTKFRGKFIKAHRVEKASDLQPLADFQALQAPERRFILDSRKESSYGGTGIPFDWKLAVSAKPAGDLILSGGLTPENLRKALLKTTPYGVDVASGVEENSKRFPGRKDAAKMQAFIETIRTWDLEHS